MSRLTDKRFLDNFKAMKNIAPDYVASTEQLMYEKLGKLEDLEEEVGVKNLIAFLEWCVKFRNNFINRTFDDMVAFYKKAMCITESKSE